MWRELITSLIIFYFLFLFIIFILYYSWTGEFELVTRGFKLVIRGFELVTCGFKLVTRGFELVTCGSELVTRGFKLLTRGFELVTRGSEDGTRGFELVTCGFELVARGFELVTRNSCFTFPRDLRFIILYQNSWKQKVHFHIFKVWLILDLVKNASATCVRIPEHQFPLTIK